KKNKPNNKEDKKTIRLIKKLNKKHNPKNANKPNLSENEIIKLVNVEKYATNGYQFEHILKGIDLTIYKGEFVVIVGPSGSGKTTLLTILSGLDRPSKGDCFMFDKNTITLNQSQLTKLRANHIGYIFQQYGLLQDLSVEDNIKIAANLTKEIKNKKFDLDKLLDSVGLLKYKKQKALNLSGGQAQRVAICRALIKNPDILFGDEPTGAIHINATKEIMNIFLDINKKFKTTIIIVTHNDAITQLADRIIRIESGKITQNFKNQRRKTVEEINWSLQ
ncbi:MAG: ABC transporter ATP-binding protein, partial [Malacoplasma sp.]|nr:ABC transporter ATP-binding protein [Malacoplasma sp.]